MLHHEYELEEPLFGAERISLAPVTNYIAICRVGSASTPRQAWSRRTQVVGASLAAD